MGWWIAVEGNHSTARQLEQRVLDRRSIACVRLEYDTAGPLQFPPGQIQLSHLENLLRIVKCNLSMELLERHIQPSIKAQPGSGSHHCNRSALAGVRWSALDINRYAVVISLRVA